MQTSPEPTLTMYTTTWCGDCHRLKRELDRADVGYHEVDIERDPDAAELVVHLNRGNETVPTVVFVDGMVMAEPSGRRVLDHLRHLSGHGESR